MNAPFHAGELAAQLRAGVVGAGGGIRDAMPDQHRLFFEAQPYLLAATLDDEGAPRAQVLHGQPGFVHSPDARTLVIDTGVVVGTGRPLGLLGLDFATRRRNRANGLVRSSVNGQLVVDVKESFGNCPQHIHVRQLSVQAAQVPMVERFEGLTPEAGAMIRAADTFFVASTGGAFGVDISHRGGPAGFVTLDGLALTIPDYRGNRYFNTLGNMLIDARVALLFIDFASGDVLELEGRATIAWAEDSEGGRSWRFDCKRGSLTRGALPLRWTAAA
jgi:predicted pyridoxine 5'-phosphate oxidase superfamily flavin-nucleotide-binding protein